MNQYYYNPVKPIVETKFGKLRGACYGNVNLFMGVRYAVAKRFRMPEEQEPWEGVKDAFTYGPITYQMMPPNPPSYYRGLHMLQKQSDDCQNLNIWAPVTKEGEKKPVLVWFHGGGYSAGNALEEYSFDGFNLAHYKDMVFVSVNHRLNIMGHLNLADYGEEYANSGNAGIWDLVAALKWVHENIAAFGGDPENVTIIGHSGGGGKVFCMYQIEEAAPYFQRGMICSGAMKAPEGDFEADTRKVAHAMLDHLGITKENIEKINDVPYQDLVEAYRAVAPDLYNTGITLNWQPVKNEFFPGFPPDAPYCEASKNKPFVIGSVMGEFPTIRLTTEEKEALTEEDKIRILNERYGDKAEKLMELFKKAYPTHDIIDLAYLDSMVRIASEDCADKRAENGLNNTYSFLFAYDAPENGRIPIWHGGEMCYLFMNEAMVYVLNEEKWGSKFSALFSDFLSNYVHTGVPKSDLLPEWKPYTREERNTMVIDCECECKTDFDTELVRLNDEAAPKFKFRMFA